MSVRTIRKNQDNEWVTGGNKKDGVQENSGER